jgi:sugar lactone lactonase YvrE
MTYSTYVVVSGLVFPESPRWHQGRFWFTDQFTGRIMTLTLDGVLDTLATLPDHAGGLGWLPDGTTLVVGMTERRLRRFRTGSDPFLDANVIDDNEIGAKQGSDPFFADPFFEPYANLTGLAGFHCNDLLVDPQGGAYVGNFGYDILGGAPTVSTKLIRVDPDGHSRAVGGPLVFPNGMALSPDGATLIVAETFARRLSSFYVSPDGELSDHRTWAELRTATPDGICLDAEGALWVASPTTRQLLRVREGGEVLDQVETLGAPYACMLGGPDRRILYVCTAETHDPAEALRNPDGRIEVVNVAVPGVGLP